MSYIAVAVAFLALSGCGDDDRPVGIDGGPTVDGGGGGGMDAQIPDGGPPEPECIGVATECALLSVETCGTVMGCAESVCTGSPLACMRRTRDQCPGGSGACTWNGTMCVGTAPTNCGDVPDMGCLDEPGCIAAPRPVCRGTPVRCEALTAETCPSQPGCRLPGPKPDGGPPGLDGGCGTFDAGTGMVDVPVHVVLGPAPVRPAENALVRIESLCGGMMEAMTDASGNASFSVERGMGPWDLTAALPGHAAVSIVDVASIALDGDIRLDPLTAPPEMPFPVSGTLTGAVGVGHTVQLDAYHFATIAAAGATWSSSYFSSPRSIVQPLTFVALELDATGHAVSAATAEVPRTMAPITGVAIAMPTPAVAPMETSATIVLPVSGTAAGAVPLGAFAETLSGLDEGQYVYSGTAQAVLAGSSVLLTVQHFPGVLPMNFAGGTADSALGRLNFYIHDFSGPTVPDIVVGEGTIGVIGTTLSDLAAMQTGATEHDVVALHIGESTADPPRWRVYAPTLPALTRVPNLPTGVTLTDIGLAPGAPTSVLSLFIEMESGRAWSAEADNNGVPVYRYSVAGMYGTVAAVGR